jgi:hypothetical protein
LEAQRIEATFENFRFFVYVEVKLGLKPLDILQKLQTVFGSAAPIRASVYDWYKGFASGERESIHHLPHSGRPAALKTSGNISRVFNFLEMNPKTSVRCMAESLDIPKTTVHRILTDELLFRKVCSVWTPHQLTEANKAQRLLHTPTLRFLC